MPLPPAPNVTTISTSAPAGITFDPTMPASAKAACDWLLRLEAARLKRVADAKVARRYYEGECELWRIHSDRFRTRFGSRLAEARDSWGALVVDAVAERLVPTGFSLGKDEAGARKLWQIWRANNLDSQSRLGLTETGASGAGFMLTWPSADPATPTVTWEDPDCCEIAYAEWAPTLRLAGLKTWMTDGGSLRFNVMVRGDGLYKFIADAPKNSGDPLVVRQLVVETDPTWPLPITDVPLVRFENRPTLRGGCGSDLTPGARYYIDAATSLLVDMLSTAEVAAYPQRYAIGLEIQLDENGKPIAPFDSGADHLWIAGGDAASGVRFGQFDAASLETYNAAIEGVLKQLAATTKLPGHMFLSNGGNPASAEQVQISEVGLVRKACDKQLVFGDRFEDVARLMFAASGDAKRAASRSIEMLWKDPTTFGESTHIDALSKKQALGVPREQLWLEAGYSPEQIDAWKADGLHLVPVTPATADAPAPDLIVPAA